MFKRKKDSYCTLLRKMVQTIIIYKLLATTNQLELLQKMVLKFYFFCFYSSYFLVRIQFCPFEFLDAAEKTNTIGNIK